MGTSLENITFLRNLETVEIMVDLDPEILQRKKIRVFVGLKESKGFLNMILSWCIIRCQPKIFYKKVSRNEIRILLYSYHLLMKTL